MTNKIFKSRYAWWSDRDADLADNRLDVPDFSEELKILEVTNPIDPNTGFPTSDLGLYFNSQVSDDVKELIARNLQRLGAVNDTSGLTDEQLMQVLPSRYTQSFGEVKAWRDTIEQFIKTDYQHYLASFAPADPPALADPSAPADPQ